MCPFGRLNVSRIHSLVVVKDAASTNRLMVATPGPRSHANPGLPKGMLGKIGLAVSPAKENRIWAVIDAEDGAIFRSDDGGENWERLSEDRNLRARPWYYQHIYADPTRSRNRLGFECPGMEIG